MERRGGVRLPRLGVVRASEVADGDHLDPELRRTLVEGEGADGVTSRSAPAYITHQLVAETGGSIQVSEPAPDVMILGATLRAG